MNQLMGQLTQFVNGKQKEGKSERYGDVYNPSTGEVIFQCPYSSQEEVNETVEIANEAFDDWRRTPIGNRVKIVRNFRNLIEQRAEQLAEIISLENGKTLLDALGEIHSGLAAVDYAISAPEVLKGEHSLYVGGEINSYSLKFPIGVIGSIAPFNFPVMIPLAMTSFAIVCGNTVILKPSERVPSAALFIADIWKQSGLPDGVLNVANGDKEAVDALLDHPKVAGIIFVGSTKVAQYIYEKASQNHKRVAAFGGGKNHMVIMPDADIDQAVSAFVGAAYGSASQRCMAISVAVPVGEKTAEEFMSKVKERVAQLKVGPYDDAEADFGALITQYSKGHVESFIEESIQAGAELCVDGRNLVIKGYENGFYAGATLLDKVTPEMRVYQEEVFGPVRSVVRVSNLDEAIKLINDHEYGNGVTIFTQNGYTARQFVETIEVGMVGVNVGVPVPAPYHNFGGWKNSKFGEGHLLGPDAIRFYTKIKTVSERWTEPKETDNQVKMEFPSLN